VKTQSEFPATKCISSEYLTTEELAVDLGVSLRTLLRWRDSRIGPPITMIGRRCFYRIEAVRQWALSREGVTRPGPTPKSPKPPYKSYGAKAPATARQRNQRREESSRRRRAA